MSSYWTIAALILGFAVFAQGIMAWFGFGGNRFVVRGKVCFFLHFSVIWEGERKRGESIGVEVGIWI